MGAGLINRERGEFIHNSEAYCPNIYTVDMLMPDTFQKLEKAQK